MLSLEQRQFSWFLQAEGEWQGGEEEVEEELELGERLLLLLL